MKRENARLVFDARCGTYGAITPLKLRRLHNMIEAELLTYLEEGSDEALSMDMKMANLREKDIVFKNNRLVFAELHVDSSYFKRREAVTFNRDGFIGFGGPLSDTRVNPIINAFHNWCQACFPSDKDFNNSNDQDNK